MLPSGLAFYVLSKKFFKWAETGVQDFPVWHRLLYRNISENGSVVFHCRHSLRGGFCVWGARVAGRGGRGKAARKTHDMGMGRVLGNHTPGMK